MEAAEPGTPRPGTESALGPGRRCSHQLWMKEVTATASAMWRIGRQSPVRPVRLWCPRGLRWLSYVCMGRSSRNKALTFLSKRIYTKRTRMLCTSNRPLKRPRLCCGSNFSGKINAGTQRTDCLPVEGAARRSRRRSRVKKCCGCPGRVRPQPRCKYIFSNVWKPRLFNFLFSKILF